MLNELLLLTCFYTFLQATDTIKESIYRTERPLILYSAFCFRFMLTWLAVERRRSWGVNSKVNMENRRKAQIFPTWASGISSKVLRVTECCILIYIVITQVLNYYRKLLRIVNQMALAPFSVSSIASILAAITRISRASSDRNVSASTLLLVTLVHHKYKTTG
jgi:hypothetical protein